MKMCWILQPLGQLERVRDSFRAGDFVVKLAGHSLEIEDITGKLDPTEAAETAERLAATYVDALREAGALVHRRIREQDYGALPPHATIPGGGGNIRGTTARERLFVRSAARAARRQLLASKPVLVRAYDYLQDATDFLVDDELDKVAGPLFKSIEVIEHEFRGERNTLRELGVPYKPVKDLLNSGKRDQRHAPRANQATNRPTVDELARARETAAEVIDRYAASCR